MNSRSSESHQHRVLLLNKRVFAWFVCLVTVFSASTALCQSAPDNKLSSVYIYKGTLETKSGKSMPVMLQVSKSQNNGSWRGAIIFGYEAGPYTFKTVTFDPQSKSLRFTYDNKTILGTLDAKLTMQADGVLSGDLNARLSADANGVLKLKLTEDRFEVRPFLGGKWTGSCINPKKEKWQGQFVLSPDPMTPRQAQIEGTLEFLPAKIGVFRIAKDSGDKDFSYILGQGSCTADYFTQAFDCLLSAPKPPVGSPVGQSNLKVVLHGSFKYDDPTIAFDIEGSQGKTSCEKMSSDQR